MVVLITVEEKAIIDYICLKNSPKIKTKKKKEIFLFEIWRHILNLNIYSVYFAIESKIITFYHIFFAIESYVIHIHSFFTLESLIISFVNNVHQIESKIISFYPIFFGDRIIGYTCKCASYKKIIDYYF